MNISKTPYRIRGIAGLLLVGLSLVASSINVYGQAEATLPALVRGGFGHFWLNNYTWATDTIIRFDVNNDDPANVHIDFGISKESTGFYLQFDEAC
ncbi:hypothetical protein [Fodinibius sediminis]|uniref:Uncharacterized protein n=1 Tax=Fodinibius sediminis TaxID=1214077 RepID=A0A521CY77_9BACT|nr:hypothetical protein [Fodinibius sediminis]SMO64362.1 hypothetical protein SAMN06265218_1086 [Fodinibius sediminis]